MDEAHASAELASLLGVRVPEHTKDLRTLPISSSSHVFLRHHCHIIVHSRNGGQNQHPWSVEGISIRQMQWGHINICLPTLKGEAPYLKDRWCRFDASMLLFLWISVVLQGLEMTNLVAQASYLSILRAPRPLIMIRFIRVFLKFSMPKSRINQIVK